MPSAGRSIVWSLLTAIVILLIGLMGLLYVSYSRDKQYANEIQDLRHKMAEKDAQIDGLKTRLREPASRRDTLRTSTPTNDSW
jgi:cell division protein FtsL